MGRPANAQRFLNLNQFAGIDRRTDPEDLPPALAADGENFVFNEVPGALVTRVGYGPWMVDENGNPILFPHPIVIVDGDGGGVTPPAVVDPENPGPPIVIPPNPVDPQPPSVEPPEPPVIPPDPPIVDPGEPLPPIEWPPTPPGPGGGGGGGGGGSGGGGGGGEGGGAAVDLRLNANPFKTTVKRTAEVPEPKARVTLTAQASGGTLDAATAQWRFGDGGTASGGASQTHEYAPGKYVARVTATIRKDNETTISRTASASVEVVLDAREARIQITMPRSNTVVAHDEVFALGVAYQERDPETKSFVLAETSFPCTVERSSGRAELRAADGSELPWLPGQENARRGAEIPFNNASMATTDFMARLPSGTKSGSMTLRVRQPATGKSASVTVRVAARQLRMQLFDLANRRTTRFTPIWNGGRYEWYVTARLSSVDAFGTVDTVFTENVNLEMNFAPSGLNLTSQNVDGVSMVIDGEPVPLANPGVIPGAAFVDGVAEIEIRMRLYPEAFVPGRPVADTGMCGLTLRAVAQTSEATATATGTLIGRNRLEILVTEIPQDKTADLAVKLMSPTGLLPGTGSITIRATDETGGRVLIGGQNEAVIQMSSGIALAHLDFDVWGLMPGTALLVSAEMTHPGDWSNQYPAYGSVDALVVAGDVRLLATIPTSVTRGVAFEVKLQLVSGEHQDPITDYFFDPVYTYSIWITNPIHQDDRLNIQSFPAHMLSGGSATLNMVLSGGTGAGAFSLDFEGPIKARTGKAAVGLVSRGILPINGWEIGGYAGIYAGFDNEQQKWLPDDSEEEMHFVRAQNQARNNFNDATARHDSFYSSHTSVTASHRYPYTYVNAAVIAGIQGFIIPQGNSYAAEAMAANLNISGGDGTDNYAVVISASRQRPNNAGELRRGMFFSVGCMSMNMKSMSVPFPVELIREIGAEGGTIHVSMYPGFVVLPYVRGPGADSPQGNTRRGPGIRATSLEIWS